MINNDNLFQKSVNAILPPEKQPKVNSYLLINANNKNIMKTTVLMFSLLVSSFIYSQMSNVTVYDDYGYVGTYTIQTNYLNTLNDSDSFIGSDSSDGIKIALKDYLYYLKQKDEKQAEEKRLAILRARGARVGISVPSEDLTGFGLPLIEERITRRENQIYYEKQAKIRAAQEAAEKEAIKKAIESNIMTAYDYAKNITLNYKKELGIKKGSGYFKLPTMLFEPQGKGKYVRQDGNIQMIYGFTWPGERNIDFADRYKQYERFSNKKMKNGESWGNVIVSRKTVYRNTGISATIVWEDEYDRGVRSYYGVEDSNGIDYTVYIESRGNKNEVNKEQVKRVFDFYKPLLEKCIANSRVIVKKLMNETIVLDTEKTKKESKNVSTNNSSQVKSSSKEDEVKKLTKTALEKYRNGDLDGAIEDSNKAIRIDKSILRSERTTFSPDQTYSNRGFYLSNKLGMEDKALEDFNTAIEINPENISAYHFRGAIKKFKKDNYGAISDFSKAYELNKDVDEFRSNLFASELKFELGDTNGAISGFKESATAHPEYAYLSLFRVYEYLERFEEAKEMASKVLSLPPYQGQLQVLGVNSKKEYINGKYEEAIDLAEKMKSLVTILDLNESEMEKQYNIYNILGASKRDNGDNYGAIAAYSRAYELNSIPQNKGGMGTAKFNLGDISGACSDWNTAIQMENISEESKEYYQKLINDNCN